MAAIPEMMMKTHQSNPFDGLGSFVSENVPLSRFTWFKLGGPARWFIDPPTIEDIQEALRRCVENQIPVYVLGLGANLLVSDTGINAAVFRLSQPYWNRMEFAEDAVQVGAGVDMQKLLVKCVRQGRSGLECLAGIPGTIGGGIRMNAGGKFGDLGASVTRVTVMDLSGNIYERHRDDMVFEYRQSNISAKFILDATLDLLDDDPERILRRTKEIWMFKRNSQPLNSKNAGCTFKNPPGLAAGALIDQVGLKGLRVGGAEVSSKHANFIIANPGCTATDVMNLMKQIQRRVQEEKGVILEAEIQIWP
jgi:UDP-N-acetylmuramate dehydrogenase